MGNLVAAALLGTLKVCAGLFGGWLLVFAALSRPGWAPPVGMYYLAWPVVFPLFAALPIAVLLGLALARTGPPYRTALRRPRFIWGVLVPLGLAAFAVMLLTCPLETGGTLFDRLVSG